VEFETNWGVKKTKIAGNESTYALHGRFKEIVVEKSRKFGNEWIFLDFCKGSFFTGP